MLRRLRIPAHVEPLSVATDDAKAEPAVKRKRAVAADHIETDRPARAARTIEKVLDQPRPDSLVVKLRENVQLVQMEPDGRLRDLHPADVGVIQLDHLYLVDLECLPEALDNPAFVPHPEGGEQRFCAVEVELGGKVVILMPRRTERKLARRIWAF